ncbi:hypothetical protein [Gloeocapsopsis dulcis]|uniref:Uncharacterized protein n=1 Tax=Gloeocapsopsis dulcis AAB1 = 1H9 TaxID=1433147 RepID=A0A6N8G2I3_9CHRO|nr:hypothetical protein [Gloeocapsopsis dulcis]MUL39543.1 hypothetical protein [Gloeocapsopsis dulcis AAB1 = 1H9]WNN92235.1 hypothetical protein P0S91_27110 [Gloeocapsopsis dulcis]
MNLPQLPREPIRPEAEADREIWQPRWRCFCCHDTGIVRLWLVEQIILDYDYQRDKSIVCQNPHCQAGENYRYDPNYDQRFSAGICAALDSKNRDSWRRTTEKRFEQIQNSIKDTAKSMSLRKRNRTLAEEMEAQQRHEEVSNAVPVKLEAVTAAYLNGEYVKEGLI